MKTFLAPDMGSKAKLYSSPPFQLNNIYDESYEKILRCYFLIHLLEKVVRT